jgi:hypothetical protein
MVFNTSLVSNQVLNVNSTSGAEQIINASGYAVQLAFSGSTCSFSAKLQVSNDPYNNTVGYVPPHFDDLASSSQTFVAAGTFTYSVTQANYLWVRLVITDNSSGTNNGTVSATITLKGNV